MWRASIFTLFPAMFPGPLGLSLAGEALSRGAWAFDTTDIREYGLGRHRAVDDRPAGGGAGMVLRADVVAAALDARLAPDDARPRLLMSPRGAPLRQSTIRRLAQGFGVVLLCGRFEGVDERLIAARGLTEVSVGDYVLSGGELAALVLLDACVRLLPGVMGAAESAHEESFENGLLEYPHYTRPRDFEGRAIPEVLLSGDHRRIAGWRRAQAETLTRERRPELMSAQTSQEARMTDPLPSFALPFQCLQADDLGLEVFHPAGGHRWRFAVAEKNGRRQLVHDSHAAGPEGPAAAERLAVDAYDFATLEARRRGWVD